MNKIIDFLKAVGVVVAGCYVYGEFVYPRVQAAKMIAPTTAAAAGDVSDE